MKKISLLLSSVCCFALNSGAFAKDISTTEAQGLPSGAILSTMNLEGGNNALLWQITPTYSERLGLGFRSTVGGYFTENFAFGAIFGISEHHAEYLANAGIRLNDNLRIIGSAAL